jgi:DNA-binding GntR family transcriptional regulator
MLPGHKPKSSSDLLRGRSRLKMSVHISGDTRMARRKGRALAPQSLGDQVYDLIKSDVILCKLTPGAEATEEGLADRYGFGRAPVRAALSRLGQDGLVTAVPRRGYRVSPITVKAVQEIFDLRLVLEPLAVRAATGRVDVQKLTTFNSRPNTPDSGKQNLRFLKSNREFHAEIIRSCGNERLIRILLSLFDEMDRLLHLGLFSESDAVVMRVNHDEQAHQHHEIIKALEEGNPDAAEKAVREHILGSRDLVMKAIVSGRLAFSI